MTPLTQYEDVFHADGMINYEFCRRLIAMAERRGWLKRSRWLTDAERNQIIKDRKGTHVS
jgi:hypothetical protein